MKGVINLSNHFLKKNGGTILTVVASVGVVATALLVAKETPKVMNRLEELKSKDEPPTKLETTKVVVKGYAPAIVSGAGTIFCIVGANVLNKRQQASLISAYTFLNNSYGQYKNKLIELYGKDAHESIVEAIAVEKAEDMNVYVPSLCSSNSLIPEEAEGKRYLFYDEFGERYFESTLEQVMAAQYHLNRNFVLRGCATLNEYYHFLGIEHHENGEELGWAIDDCIYWIDFDNKKAKLKDGTEYIIVYMEFYPTTEWQDLYA